MKPELSLIHNSRNLNYFMILMEVIYQKKSCHLLGADPDGGDLLEKVLSSVRR